MSSNAVHVVIGGLGTVGRELQRQLLQDGRRVRVLDLPRGNNNVVAETLLVHPSIEFIPFRLGVDDSMMLTKALKGAETVFSCVTPDVQNGTVRDFELTNYVGIQQLVECCSTAGIHRLVYASSMAVTNHLIMSQNVNECTPLPAMDTYRLAYDRTKRLGEDYILAANLANLRTVAIRIGAVLGSYGGFLLRDTIKMGVDWHRVCVPKGQPIDTIAVQDVVRALVLADKKLSEDNSPVAGRAIFVTKASNSTSPAYHELAQYVSKRCGWPVRIVPSVVCDAIDAIHWCQYQWESLIANDPLDLPGMPRHVYYNIRKYRKNFDNSLARTLLGFEPKLSWQEAIDQIVEEIQANQSGSVAAAAEFNRRFDTLHGWRCGLIALVGCCVLLVALVLLWMFQTKSVIEEDEFRELL